MSNAPNTPGAGRGASATASEAPGSGELVVPEVRLPGACGDDQAVRRVRGAARSLDRRHLPGRTGRSPSPRRAPRGRSRACAARPASRAPMCPSDGRDLVQEQLNRWWLVRSISVTSTFTRRRSSPRTALRSRRPTNVRDAVRGRRWLRSTPHSPKLAMSRTMMRASIRARSRRPGGSCRGAARSRSRTPPHESEGGGDPEPRSIRSRARCASSVDSRARRPARTSNVPSLESFSRRSRRCSMAAKSSAMAGTARPQAIVGVRGEDSKSAASRFEASRARRSQ